MSEENEDLAQLLAIVNQEEDEDEEQLTEEELQQALSSPSLHRQVLECGDEESTECDDYEMMSTQTNDNRNSDPGLEVTVPSVSSSSGQQSKQKSNEYQFQMLDHHIFKGKHGKKLYKCDICYAVYRHSFSLKRHFIRSHINYGYLCETDVTNCGINLSASASLQTWKQQIDGQPLDPNLAELYCCHSCVLFYDDLSQIKAHVDDCHRNTKSGTIEPIRIPCSQCNMSFIQRHNLMRHIEVVHCGKRLYQCKHCSKKFQTIADRKKHEKNQHQTKEQSDQQFSQPPSPTPTKPQKSHKCLKCSQLLVTYSELRKHVTKKHKEFYNPCGYCNKFCFSKKQLSGHLRQKHEKTSKENTDKLKTKTKVTARQQTSEQKVGNASQALSQQNQFQAYFHCSLCYRRFLTYGSLIRHKQIAHRPQHVRNCSRLRTDTHVDNEIVEPYNSSQEFEFYRHLAQKVAENLLYFVDGKFVNSCNDYKVIPNLNHKKNSQNPEINLQNYNFPNDYKRESSSPPAPTASTDQLEFLFDCNLNKVKNPKFEPLIIESNCDSMPSTLETSETPLKPQFICTACHQKISVELLAEHEINNHPNVYCTYIEVEPFASIPSKLLLWQYHCAEGLLRRCPTAPSLATTQEDSRLSLKCTKCQNSFASVSLLHNHILDCAHQTKDGSHSSNKSNNKSDESVDALTSLSSITANTSTNSNTSLIDINDSLTETNTTLSSNCTQFSSPLSPRKTRSGKRRQITPENYVKAKRTRNSSKNSSSDIKQINNSNNKSEETITKNENFEINYNNLKSDEMLSENECSESTPNESDNSRNNNSVSHSSIDCLPKRYSCKKCSKKFVYMDSLSKHQLSCKRVFQSNVNKKRKLRNSKQKLAKNIELKAIKNINKNNEKKSKILEQNSCKSIDNNDDNSTTNDDTEEEEIIDLMDNKEEPPKETSSPNIESSSEPIEISSTPNDDKQNEKTVDSITGLQEHRCPDCFRVFTYLANFRKHITNVCPVRKQLSNENNETEGVLTSKSPKESPVSEIIVIKQEIADKDIDSNEDNAVHEEVIFDDETKIEPNIEEEEDISLVTKDESKLDLWRVKQENPQFAFKGSPAQHHSCPYCQRGFTYLANYRKHIKSICPIRQQIDEKKKQVIEDNDEQENIGTPKIKAELPTLVYTPSSLSVRSQIEDTVLTLLRDQTKQDQILQSSEDLIKAKSAPKADNSSPQQLTNSGDIEANESTESESSLKLKNKDLEIKDNKTKESTQTLSTTGKGPSYRFRTFSCNICHKIFLSYVAMLKHRLSHKLSDGSTTNEDNHAIGTNCSHSKSTIETNNELIEENGEKEAANQALAQSILKRSKDVIISKMRINAANSANYCNSNTKPDDSKATTGISKPVINTTELLEKLARGGITTDSIQSFNTSNKLSTKCQEVITIETNNNNNNFNLQLSASTSNNNNNKINNNNNNLEQIIIDTNNLNDLELNVLKDGVIVTQDLQQLIAVEDADEEDTNKCGVNEVLLNLDDIENANEVWITITDSSALIQVPDTPNNNNTK